MDQEVEKSRRNAIYRRLLYMVIAILAAALLPLKPAFSFQDDKGIIYIRSFEMDQKTFYVTQTEMETGIQTVTDSMSVKGLYYCYKALLWGCIACLLCFFSFRWRIVVCDIVMITAGVYYVLMVIYAMRISDIHFATLYPTWITILPAIIMQMMVLTRRSAVRSRVDETDDMEENIPQKD